MHVSIGLIAAAAILAGPSSAQMANSTQGGSSITTSLPVPTGEACAVVSSIIAAFQSANPSGSALPSVPPSKALACLNVVPLDANRSSAFIDFIKPFIQFQSTLTYLNNPPTGYTLPGVDILGGLDQIKQNISNGKYNSQWAFEKDVVALINFMPKDFHLSLGDSAPLSNVFIFTRGVHLVSISADGLEIPQIFVADDINATFTANSAGSRLNWTPSPIVSIDQHPISSFLQVISLHNNFQDPDALFNQLFLNPALAFSGFGDLFNNGGNVFGLGDTSSYQFANDTSTFRVIPNSAFINPTVNFTNIHSGQDLFTEVVLPPPATDNSTTSTSAPSVAPTASSIIGYPTNPIAIHPEGYTAGFFLDGADDVCILVMSAFAGKLPNTQALMQQVIQDTLSNCTASGKTKLIVDVSANGGGAVFSGFDAFKQLFPSIEPFGGSRMRLTPLTQYLIESYSEADIYNETQNTVYQTQASLDVNLQPFSSAQAMYGPFGFYGDEFTAELRNNLSDPTQINPNGTGITITGYGVRASFEKQPFTSDNIVMLMDGTCGSTCSIFAELMKSQGNVRSVAVGGRLQTGPMQGVGGSKGSQVFSFLEVQSTVNNVPDAINSTLITQNNTLPAEYIPSLDSPPLGPSLQAEVPSFNLRNSYKPVDSSQTPTQFIYESANCRLFYTAEDLNQVENLWQRVANVTWGKGTCVAGSTSKLDNTISSLANDTVPFSPAVMSNVTTPFTGPGSLQPNSSSPSSISSSTASSSPASSSSATSGKSGSTLANLSPSATRNSGGNSLNAYGAAVAALMAALLVSI